MLQLHLFRIRMKQFSVCGVGKYFWFSKLTVSDMSQFKDDGWLQVVSATLAKVKKKENLTPHSVFQNSLMILQQLDPKKKQRKKKQGKARKQAISKCQRKLVKHFYNRLFL